MKLRFLNIFLGIIIITVTGCATLQHAVARHETFGDVTFTVCLPKPNAATDPAPLHLKLENQRSEGIGFAWWERGIDISASTAVGGTVRRTEAGKTIFMFELPKVSLPEELAVFESVGRMAFLHPGQSIETTIDIAQLFAFTPGKYTLTVSARVVHPALSFQIRSLPFRVDSRRRLHWEDT